MARNIHIIVAHDIKYGIGCTNEIPFHLKEDLKRFKSLTTGHVVVMGRKTWDSLPPKVKPLPNRQNFIISRTMTYDEIPEEQKKGVMIIRNLHEVISEKFEDLKIFIIGGGEIYDEILSEKYTRFIRYIYITEVFTDSKCDVFFPNDKMIKNLLNDPTICKHKRYESIQMDNGYATRYKTIYFYDQDNEMNTQLPSKEEEKKYLNLMKNTMLDGELRMDRTRVGIISVFGKELEFDLHRGNCFPLFTTKRVFFRGVAEELFFFLSGKTNVKILQDRDVHIWDGNSSREYLDNNGLQWLREGDLGKFYGFQWRHFGADYTNCDEDYTGCGYDQVAEIVRLIKEAPTSRRILLSGWNPCDLNKCCLPPCHVLYQFYVNCEEKTLSLQMYQRSADLFLGVPFNIASVAIFVYLMAKTCDLLPDKIKICFGDTHLYSNHLESVLTQIEREPLGFPKLLIKEKRDKLEDYTIEDLELVDYKCHGAIKAKMAV